ncbi:MAG: hypothetical protein RIQ78_503 [Bacteroidota bacterium]|jgi:hypothetical protein
MNNFQKSIPAMSTFRAILPYLLVLFSLTQLPGSVTAQTAPDTTNTGKSEGSIELLYTESNNHSKILTATVKSKISDSYVGAAGVVVGFFLTEATPENILGSSTTNEKGEAVFVMPPEKSSAYQPNYTFVASIENNTSLEDLQEEITISESDMNMTLEEADSVRQIVVTLETTDADGNTTPISEVEVHFYVQRLFGLLPLSADPQSTDANGEITLEFPAGIPGDTAGNVVIVAKVEEHELFGNLDFRKKISWGVPLIIDHNKHIRALWSSRENAPYYLIVIVNSMLIGIWGVIAYIVFQVFQIRKLGRQKIA